VQGILHDNSPQLPGEEPGINPSVPRHLAKDFLWLPDAARSLGTHIQAGKGSGKSRLMGRVIAFLDFLRGTPTVILDPNGPTIDNFLDKLTRLPREAQEQLWTRVIYVDMSGQSGYAVTFPLYYRLGGETLYTISQRPLDVIRKTDPWLQTASVEGWNALWRVGTHAGMLLAALRCQITEAQDLLTNPEAWAPRFDEALHMHPDARPAVEFFRGQYLQWDERTRARRIDSFVNKTAIFNLDPTMTAMFGGTTPGLEWERVIRNRCIVLVDLRREYDTERRRFKMLWAFSYFLDYIKHRGAGHRHQPVSLIVDELASLFNVQAQGANALVADLDELINVIARNYRVWLTLAHQEMFQFDERTQKTLLTMGTQIFGSTADLDAAVNVARSFLKLDPYKVKRYEPIYGSELGMPRVLDHRPVEFSIEEQQLMQAYRVKEQPAFHFLVRPASGEGTVAGGLYPVTIRNFDKNMWPNEELVAEARARLSKRSGVLVEKLLGEITTRRAAFSATMNGYATNARITKDDLVPLSTTPAAHDAEDYTPTYDGHDTYDDYYPEKK
jgi:hypothetical protein